MRAEITLKLIIEDGTIKEFMDSRGYPKEKYTAQGKILEDYSKKDVKRELEDIDAQELIDWSDVDWSKSRVKILDTPVEGKQK